MPTIAAKRSSSVTPDIRPIPATMIPTSPLGTMPTLMMKASCRPSFRVAGSVPASLVTIARAVNPSRRPITAGSAKTESSTPMPIEAKKNGGKKARR